MSDDRWEDIELLVIFAGAAICAAAGQHVWAIVLFSLWVFGCFAAIADRKKRDEAKARSNPE